MDSERIEILIAEDENIIAMDLRRIVEKLGYHVQSVVHTGEDVLKQVDIKKPGLVLMDIELDGDKNGIETAQILYNKYLTPVVYITALNDSRTIEQAKSSSTFGFVAKPFDEDTLQTAILKVLNNNPQKKIYNFLVAQKKALMKYRRTSK